MNKGQAKLFEERLIMKVSTALVGKSTFWEDIKKSIELTEKSPLIR